MAATKKAQDAIARWRKAHATWSDRLPKHCEYFELGQWRFAMTDAERLAAGWERTEDWASERDPAKIAAWKPKDAADSGAWSDAQSWHGQLGALRAGPAARGATRSSAT